MHSNTMTEDYNEKRYTLSTQFLLDFNRTFNNVHNVSALVGVSNESYTKQASRCLLGDGFLFFLVLY